MQKWLNEKGHEVHKEYMRKMRNRPVGVDTSQSEDNDEEDDEVFELPEKKIEERTKRKSVSAEVYGVYNPKGNFTPEVWEKSDEEKEMLKNLLSNIFMFKSLEENEMNIILDAMKKKVCESGDEIIKQGDDGAELYVVSKGKLTCSRK